jgi:pyochelin biosynthetic protein PchC
MVAAWVRRFHPAPQAATRLICFPHAGGSATFYFPISQAMSPAVDVLAIQYPGRQDRFNESCIDDIRTMADLITEEIARWADRPVTLFGHSMGATVAFEVAIRLERRGIVARGLFASARRAPTRHRDGRIHLADDAGLISSLEQLGGTEAPVIGDPALLRMILPTLRSDYRAIETYRFHPGPPLNCPITVLIGDDDPHVTIDEAEEWKQQTRAAFRMRVFRGGHFYINAHTEAVLREIREHIEPGSRYGGR